MLESKKSNDPLNRDGNETIFLESELTSTTEHAYRILHPGDFTDESERGRRINTYLEQGSIEDGLLGARIKSTGEDVRDILKTYFDPSSRFKVNEQNRNAGTRMNFFEATALNHKLELEEFMAGFDYYLRHEEVFNAYFLVENAKTKKDTLITSNILPKQLTFE